MKTSITLFMLLSIFSTHAQPTTLEYQINSSIDDVEEGESSGHMYITSSDIELVFDLVPINTQMNQKVGLRFNDIQLPPGATIDNAYLQFTSDEINDEETNLIIRGILHENAPEFQMDSFNLSSRPTTSSEVQWTDVPAWSTVGEQGPNQQTPNLSTIITEIISLPGWQESNSMAFIITGTGERTAEAYNGDQTLAPKLIIDFSLNPVSVEDYDNDLITIFPNPTYDQLNLKFESNTEKVMVNIVHVDGSVIQSQQLGGSINTIINVNNIPNGIYLLKLINEHGEIIGLKRIIKV